MAFPKGDEMNLFPLNLEKHIDILPCKVSISRSFSGVVPELLPGKYQFGITLQTLTGSAINESFSSIRTVKR